MPLTVPTNAMQGSVNGVNTSVGMTAVNGCKRWLGTDYAWGGGDASGPTYGIHDGGVADAHGDYLKKGFDCSGLVQNGWAYAGVQIPGDTRSQWSALSGNQVETPQAGDLLYYPGHVAMYIDGSSMIEAPQSGDVVKISPLRMPRNNGLGNWKTGIVRPQGGTAIASDGSTTAAAPIESGTGAATGLSIKAWVVIGAVAVVGFMIVMNVGMD